jgi:dihydropteroate synthase
MGYVLPLPRGRELTIGRLPLIMGIVNATPDSFYEESRSPSAERSIDRALRLEAEGAAIIDVGGESSRPGSAYVGEEEEAARVIPVIEGIRRRSDAVISIDTRKASVARLALDAGADIVNDISALEDDPLLGPLAARSGAALILMHKKGQPSTMQESPCYEDCAREVRDYLLKRAKEAEAMGVPRGRIMLDPGIGFGKRQEDNVALLRSLADFALTGYPLVIGASRKSFLGAITGRGVAQRLAASLAAAIACALNGASVIRVHDVAETRDAIAVLDALCLLPAHQER